MQILLVFLSASLLEELVAALWRWFYIREKEWKGELNTFFQGTSLSAVCSASANIISKTKYTMNIQLWTYPVPPTSSLVATPDLAPQ